MTPSIWQLLIVLVIVLLLFGRGKIPQLMGDMVEKVYLVNLLYGLQQICLLNILD